MTAPGLDDRVPSLFQVNAQSAAPPYGMLTDRFGITWIFGITAH